MLIIYNNKNIVSISGFKSCSNITEDMVDSITISDMPPDQQLYRIYDNDFMKKVWAAKDVGVGIELIFDEGKPVGIKTDIVKLTCPATTAVNQSVIISVDHDASLFIDGEQKAIGTEWQIVFETPGTYLIEVDAGKHGKVSQEVVVS